MVMATCQSQQLALDGWLAITATERTSWPEMVAGATAGATWREWSERIAWAERLLVRVQAGGAIPSDEDLALMVDAMSFDGCSCRSTGDLPAWAEGVSDAVRRQPWDHAVLQWLGVPSPGDRLGEPISHACMLHLRRGLRDLPANVQRVIHQTLVENPWREGHLHHITLLPVGRQPAIHLRSIELPPL